jgi:hypothetical protein
MRLTFTATVEQFDAEAYGAAVRDAIRKCFMKAGQKFLLAAIPKVKIWTGMARGAFRNLEDIVGKVTNDAQSGNVRIRTTQNKKPGSGAGRGGGENIRQKFRRGYFYKPPGGARIERTPQAGRQFATPGLKIFDIAGEATKTKNTSYHFRFEINITYADDRNWWDAFHAGQDAFESYVKANLKLPDPLKFMTRKVIKV